MPGARLMSLGPGAPDPPTGIMTGVHQTAHRAGEQLAIQASLAPGGLHHEYSLGAGNTLSAFLRRTIHGLELRQYAFRCERRRTFLTDLAQLCTLERPGFTLEN